MSDFAPLIVASELEQRLTRPDWRVVDCRFDLMNPSAGRAEWLDGHIPGALYADLDENLAGPITETSGRHPLPDEEKAAQFFGGLGIGAKTKVVVYDSGSGAIAARAWWLLRWLGHERVALLDGGYAGWVRHDGVVEQGEVHVAPETFLSSPHNGWLLTTNEVEAWVLEGKSVGLVDARDKARFCGDVEPIDRVAGHIPGSTNLPFSENLRSDGTWKAPGALRRLWAATLGERTDGDWGVMCGSGVTACHLALSAKLAGLHEPRLYVGSWSEWIRNSDRPVATGP
ncbi:MAG: sulfurtransferase [Gammaproteobacteria bacterium]|nr:sulfurtransferase [Gammaproteobacteria bacterium]